ncbi:MAG: 2,3-bisphosphoglycerate-independent phosphoglycerate mutase [Chloroflexi bacterium]|nr:2,3-bisphosphoglycerate-independent phosphoglycerate mutase [Chloroflexota bacterium]
MAALDLIKSLSIVTPSKIILLVIDGVGGLPRPGTGGTELETAKTLNLDRLAGTGMCGLSNPIGPGITPGSSPGHLGLFGYDPVAYNIGRGVLEAVGIDFPLEPGDVVARGNFCTIDEAGRITDRRAGRISTDKCVELSRLLNGMSIGNAKVLVEPAKDYRFIGVFRGTGLSAELADSDPQRTGVPPLAIAALAPAAEETARIANEFAKKAKEILAGHYPANMALLRGFSQRPDWPTVSEIYKLTPAAVASYPMYRGLARLVGMNTLSTGGTVAEEFETLAKNYKDYDFFFVHIKGADAAGEDGDFDRKVAVIEEIDRALPVLSGLQPDVLVVTGDHSTPAMLKAHSWHPVPVLLYSRWCRPDNLSKFSESACRTGGLGRISATDIMPLAMAHALKLNKFGA